MIYIFLYFYIYIIHKYDLSIYNFIDYLDILTPSVELMTVNKCTWVITWNSIIWINRILSIVMIKFEFMLDYGQISVKLKLWLNLHLNL